VHSFIVTSSAWVYLRHWQPTKGVPWVLAKLVDCRLSIATRTSIVERLSKLNKCCADRLTMVVLNMVDNPADLFSPVWQRRLWAWVRSIYLHTASLENRHARNKQQTKSECVVWSNFCAQYVLSESKCLMFQHLRLHNQHLSLSALQDEQRTQQTLEDQHVRSPDQPQQSAMLSTRATVNTPESTTSTLAQQLGFTSDLISKSGFVRSGIQLYHLHRLDSLREANLNPITSSFWKQIHVAPSADQRPVFESASLLMISAQH